MDSRVIQFRVGVLVVATCIITAILILLFGELPNFNQYTLYVSFDQAPGVAEGTAVRKSGIFIGRVSRVDLAEDGTVLVHLRIDNKRKVFRNEICRIQTKNLLGDAELEFVRTGNQGALPQPYSNGDSLKGVVANDPTKALDVFIDLEDDLTSALASINRAGEDVGSVARSLNAVVENNKDQFQRILQKSEIAMQRFDQAMITVDQLVGDAELRNRLQEALAEVPKLLAGARDALGSLQNVADTAERNLANLEGLTGPLGERGEEIVNQAEQSIARIDDLLVQLVEFAEDLNNSEGTVAQLVQNPDLYQNLNQAAMNIEEVTRRLRPIVDDARVIADKVARDPSRVVGLKSLISGRQSGMKR
ncbi:MAG: MlaD family protein [Pirellulaceae bacterium]|nr:MCE family protein [Planctomycetales bacterium]